MRQLALGELQPLAQGRLCPPGCLQRQLLLGGGRLVGGRLLAPGKLHGAVLLQRILQGPLSCSRQGRGS